MLAQGGHLNVHYHVVNGHPYRSIGRMLIDEGKITKEEMSMQKIRSYLKEHPGEVDRVLNYNPSYVFFKLEEEGPVGFLQVKLTPVRSIALDRRLFPPAALAFIETERPELDHYGEIFEWRDLKAFVLNQDTGGAIRGPGRADLFWGNGHYAEVAAGYMQHPGRLYFLVLKPDIE
jgi:membrane-bound lytic murein transglycosylase A